MSGFTAILILLESYFQLPRVKLLCGSPVYHCPPAYINTHNHYKDIYPLRRFTAILTPLESGFYASYEKHLCGFYVNEGVPIPLNEKTVNDCVGTHQGVFPPFTQTNKIAKWA